MTNVSKALILTLLISGGGYAALAAAAPTEIVSPICIQDSSTFKIDTNPNVWCDGGKVIHLAGTTGPDSWTSDGKMSVAALSRLVGGMPLRCRSDDFTQPVVDARCWNEAGQDVGAQMRAQGYLR